MMLSKMGRRATALAFAGAVLAGAAEARATFTPAQVRSAYGLNGLTFGNTGVAADGTGMTIAIIDWYNDPNILTETAKFNSQFGLPTFNTGGPTLKVVGQTGGSSLPTTTTSSLETALDVQWAHAMAPKANILLVEPNNAQLNSTAASVNYAKSAPGVSVISMSFGATSFNGESSLDSQFAQPAGHDGVTFVASTGDASTPSYPATSTHVIAVGGTRLTISGSGARTNEVVWQNSNGTEGTGYSVNFARPTFQNGANANAKRGIPDVVMDGDPATGVYVYFGAGTNSTLYGNVGGTSLAAPMFAGLIAVANQGRELNGLDPLTGDEALTMMYALIGTPLYSDCFYDVTSGSANGFAAGAGFDTPSGLGAPKADGLINYLAGFTSIPEPSAAAWALLAPVALRRRARRA